MNIKEGFKKLEIEDKLGLIICFILMAGMIYVNIEMGKKMDFSTFLPFIFIISPIINIIKKLKNNQDNE